MLWDQDELLRTKERKRSGKCDRIFGDVFDTETLVILAEERNPLDATPSIEVVARQYLASDCQRATKSVVGMVACQRSLDGHVEFVYAMHAYKQVRPNQLCK